MQTMGRKGPGTAAVVLALVVLEMVSTIEALGQEQHPEPTQPVEFRLFSAEWAGKLPEESLKIALLKWIGANSEYNASRTLANPPEVKFCEHGSTLVYEGKAIHFDSRLNGVYDETTKQICLAKPWHASSVKDQSVLLHELVHHVQFESKNWPCPKATEWEAYKLQEAWLLENGVRPEFNWLYILLDSSCAPRDVHP